MDQDVVERMKEVEGLVLELDESVRGAAFGMFKDYILDGISPTHGATQQTPDRSIREIPAESETELESFFAERDTEKPAQAALSIAAFLYHKFGTEPFSVTEVKELADNIGLTVPGRLDMTFRSSKRNGKPVFRPVGKGKFSPTVLGETILKKEFNVTKGRNKRVVDDSGDDQ